MRILEKDLLQVLFPRPDLLPPALHVEWHAGAAAEVTFMRGVGWWVEGCCACAIRARSRGGVEEGSCGGVHRRSEVSLPFRVTGSCQECPSPARSDHVLDAPTLFLTRQGGSVAGFRE